MDGVKKIEMKKMVFSAALIILASYSAIVGVIFFKQGSMVYFPEKEIVHTPKNINLDYREVAFQTKDRINISGWYIPVDEEKGVLIFCHGNGGNISYNLEYIRILHSLSLSVFMFDYRGYGKSEGKPSEEGTYLDAAAAWDYLIQQGKSPEKIIVYGQSLGGAVAAEIALRKNPAALIIESSFTSIPDLGAKLYPWLPVKLISKFRYSTKDKVGMVKCPKLVIHSPDDEIIPFEHGRAIYEKATQPKEFLETRGGHNDGLLVSEKAYKNGLKMFLEKYIIAR